MVNSDEVWGQLLFLPIEVIVLNGSFAWLIEAAPYVNSLIHASFDSRGNIACGLENRPYPWA